MLILELPPSMFAQECRRKRFEDTAFAICQKGSRFVRGTHLRNDSKPLIYVTSLVEDSFGGCDGSIALLLDGLACRLDGDVTEVTFDQCINSSWSSLARLEVLK